jgi:hypothetical protein
MKNLRDLKDFLMYNLSATNKLHSFHMPPTLTIRPNRSQIYFGWQPWRAAYTLRSPNLGGKINFWEEVILVDLILS